MTEHTFLVAVVIDSDTTREVAEQTLRAVLPRPGAIVLDGEVQCWWIAEDDRRDGSDNDSAVFVTPGAQQAAFEMLHAHHLTPGCNDPASQGRGTIHFELED